MSSVRISFFFDTDAPFIFLWFWFSERFRLETHPKEEMAAHSERMKKLIPKEKLLVYEIGEGWDRLVEFLGVPKPDEPFPYENKSQAFEGKSNDAFKGE